MVGSVPIMNLKSSAATAGRSDDDDGEIKFRSLQKEHMNPETVDDMLSKELQQLSFATRSEINEEVHGVRCLAPEETPALLQESLQRLQEELSLLQRQNKAPAYDQTLCRYPHSYIHQVDFKLRFLRAELFDCSKAAVRMSLFLDLLLEFFGQISLERPIQLTDLSKTDMDVLRGGDIQPLPFRDRSGRRLLTTVNQFCLQYPFESRFKANIYLHWALSGDLESQKKGFIAIFCWPSKDTLARSFPRPGDEEFAYGRKLIEGVPWRMCAMHMCFPDTPVFQLMRSGMFLIMGERRARIRLHLGDGIENQYNLTGYGIAADQLPVTDSGNVKTKNLHQWLRVRKAYEGSVLSRNDNNHTALSTIECPGSNDVVFRSGQAYLCHRGNITFRGLIEDKFREHYAATTSDAKVNITWWIIEQVEQNGGRFLLWDNGWWKQMDDKLQVRTKVANAFKDHKRRVKALSNCQVSECSTFKFEDQDGKKRKRRDSVDSGRLSGPQMFCM